GGVAVGGVVMGGGGSGNAGGARREGIGELALHRGEVGRGGGLRERALAHGVGTERRVPDVARVVDALGPALEGLEVLGVGLPAPVDARLHGLGGNVLRTLEV